MKSSQDCSYKSSAFLYGQSVFTTLKIVLREVYFWDDHWQRLEQNTQWLWQRSLQDKRDEIEACVFGYKKSARLAALRISIFKVDDELGWAIHECKLDRIHQTPLKIKLTEHPAFIQRRPHYVKMAAYGDVLRVKEQYLKEGFDDVLFSHEHKIAESIFGNIFFLMKSGEVVTPASEYGILMGITRHHVIKALEEKGRQVSQREFFCHELDHVSGAFLTSSIQGVRFIEKIDQLELKCESDEVITIWRNYLEHNHG